MPIPGGMTRPISQATDPTVDARGCFAVGTSATFFFSFVDLRGMPYDPSEFTIQIFDPDDVSIGTDDYLDKITTGEFAYVWSIPHTYSPGLYRLRLSYTVQTAAGPTEEIYSEEFVVVEKGALTLTTSRMVYRALVESLIGYIQKIPVWHEVVRFEDRARSLGKLSFSRWNQTAGVELLHNGSLMESGYTVDYLNGRIEFSVDIAEEDEVLCTYNFRWFTDQELDDFVDAGIDYVNIWPPQWGWHVGNIPAPWPVASNMAAAVFIMQRWMTDILFQEPAKIFGGLDRANEIFAHMNELKKNYEDRLDKMLEQKKNFPYLGLTKTVTVPEFTLPGGRSRWFRYLFKGA